MADQLFKKRQAAGKQARAKETRVGKKRILIVCEGEKTEVEYFKGAVHVLGIDSSLVKICGNCGSDPMNIMKYAQKLCTDDKDYDQVFCVFDRDTHKNFADAISKITKKPKYHAITSTPCFELWFLLHFKYSDKPYTECRNNSPCDNLIKDLKKCDPSLAGYEKNLKGLYKGLETRLPEAKKHAESLLKEQRSVKEGALHGSNPSTFVHQLINTLEDMAQK